MVPYLLLLAGAVLWMQADTIPASPFQIIGAAEYSRGVAAAVLLTGGCCALSDLYALLKAGKAQEAAAEKQKFPLSVLTTTILLVVYALGISFLGYTVSTFCFLLLSMWSIGAIQRSGITISLCFAAGSTLLMYCGMRVFNVLLPETLLF
jgi:hypothetical protein